MGTICRSARCLFGWLGLETHHAIHEHILIKCQILWPLVSEYRELTVNIDSETTKTIKP